MKIKFFISLLSLFIFSVGYSDETKQCKELVDKPIEWSKCVKNKSIELGKEGSKKLNTDSTLTEWLKKAREKYK
tara:strand:- start:92 stop:313 length:222 start_codon:yes stop_codon:yes gene_type:complete